MQYSDGAGGWSDLGAAFPLEVTFVDPCAANDYALVMDTDPATGTYDLSQGSTTVTWDAATITITGNSLTSCGVTYKYPATIPAAL